MKEIHLDVQVRNTAGTRRIKALRRMGFIPGIVYGGRLKPTVIQFERKALEHIRRLYHGEVIFHLNVMEGDKKLREYATIVKEEQHDPVTDRVVHIDFNRISLTEKIEVKVPISAKGEAVGVKQDGGSLDHVMWELTVTCLPTQIPDQLEIDVTSLKIGDSIHLKDIKLPEGVTTKVDLESIVFKVVPPMKEDVATVEEKVEVEVIKEKKEKPGEEKGAEGEAPKEEKKEVKKEEKK